MYCIQEQLSKLFFLNLQSDKKRTVDENESRIWANNCGFHYFETSAQTGDGVNKMFEVEITKVHNFCSY